MNSYVFINVSSREVLVWQERFWIIATKILLQNIVCLFKFFPVILNDSFNSLFHFWLVTSAKNVIYVFSKRASDRSSRQGEQVLRNTIANTLFILPTLVVG